MRKICMIGHGGHSKVVEDIINTSNQHLIIACLDDKYSKIEKKNGIIYGPVTLASHLAVDEALDFIIAIGNNQIRKKVEDRLQLPDNRYAVLIHSSAIISPSVSIGNGSVIMPGVVINADTKIGMHTIINTGAVVEHDNVIGSFVHICPKAVLTGSVKIGEGSLIGAGTAIIPGRSIGKWCMIGAGSTVIRDIQSRQKAAGVPAIIIDKGLKVNG